MPKEGFKMDNCKVDAFVRDNGEMGIRNYILVLSSVVCANRVVDIIDERSDCENLITITHQHGCSQAGQDKEQTVRTLQGIVAHPNVGAALVIGLGCETVKPDELIAPAAEKGKPCQTLMIQEEGGVKNTAKKGVNLTKKFRKKIITSRSPVNLENITVGVECGGSDAFSGITANPAVGAAADLIVEKNGTVILSEVPEMIGAEHILAERCVNETVREKLISVVESYEEKALDAGIDIREANPSPGNKSGGITTLEEKSLGCIYKGGSTPIKQVVDYGESANEDGLIIMKTPGNDVESITGMAAGGAQIIVFTTGRGTPVGCAVAPTLKVSTNSKVFNEMQNDIDLNAGKMIDEDLSKNEMGKKIFKELLQVIEGKKPRSEKLGQFDFSINRIGPTF